MRTAEPRHPLFVLTGVALTLGLPRVAMASEGGFLWSIQGWYILDFLLIAVPLVWWLAPKTRGFLKARRELAGRELESARASRDEALARLAIVDTHMSTLSAEVEHLMHEFRELGVDEQEAIRKDAVRQIERMHEDARFRIQQAGKMARQVLTQTLVSRALAKAEEEMLIRHINHEMHSIC